MGGVGVKEAELQEASDNRPHKGEQSFRVLWR